MAASRDAAAGSPLPLPPEPAPRLEPRKAPTGAQFNRASQGTAGNNRKGPSHGSLCEPPDRAGSCNQPQHPHAGPHDRRLTIERPLVGQPKSRRHIAQLRLQELADMAAWHLFDNMQLREPLGLAQSRIDR